MGILNAIGRWFTEPADASSPNPTKLGVFDTTLPPILRIDSGDVINYRDTWSHFLNQLQPAATPRRHEFGSARAARRQRRLERDGRGHDDVHPRVETGALSFTGDSHAGQGDGEINLSALESRMKELRIQVVLHKNKTFSWPIAETPTHWIILAMNPDLNVAMATSARNAITFLSTRTNISPFDAYALFSVAASFRITQVVDIARGVHCMIPKSLFAPDFQPTITVV